MPTTASPPSHTSKPAKAYVAPHLKEYDYKDSLESTSWSDTPKQDLSSLLSDAKRRKAAQRAPPPPATATPIRKQQRESRKPTSRRIDFVPLADRDKHRRSKRKPEAKRKGPAPSATALLEEQGKSAPMLLNSMFERGMLQWDHYDDETHGHCLRVHDHRAMGHYIGTEKVKSRLRDCGLVHPSPRHQWWLVPQSAREIPPRYGRVGPGDDADADPIVLRPPPQWALKPIERCARFFGWRMDAPNGEHSENGFGCVVPKTSHQPCRVSDPPPPPPPQRPDYSLPLPPQESDAPEPEPEPEPEPTPERYALQDLNNLDAMAFD
jgi:hypothetical protein